MTLVLPNGAEPYLALQRTAYQHPVNRVFRKLRLGRWYDRALMPRIESRRNAHLASAYGIELDHELQTMVAALPERPRAVLDVGSGMAGIDLKLWQRYGGQVELHLLDKNGVSDVFYGFEREAAFYNSMALARQFLLDNGVPEQSLHLHNVDADGFPQGQRFDLVLSIISWGFHYPVRTYAEAVRDSLSEQGVVIIDIRNGTGGEHELGQTLGRSPKTLLQTDKYQRVAYLPAS